MLENSTPLLLSILLSYIQNKLLFTVYVFTLPRGGIGRQYPMHEVVPSVVAMAVRMVMAMCRIFCQIDFVSMVSRLVISYEL